MLNVKIRFKVIRLVVIEWELLRMTVLGTTAIVYKIVVRFKGRFSVIF